MKKTFTIFILTLIFLAGCQSASLKTESSDTSFDEREFIPTSALSSNIYTLDLNNDGTAEKAIHYVNRDDLDGAGHYSKRDHINIYQQSKNSWEMKYEYIFPTVDINAVKIDWKSLEESNSRISAVTVTDIANDGAEELLVLIESKPFGSWRFNSYEFIGKQDNEISNLDFPRGFDGKTPGMRLEDTGEFYGRMLGVDFVDGKIVEKWGGTCEGGINPCYTFEFEISYGSTNGSWNISKAKNIQRVTAEWDKYVEEYGEKEWSGTLPF